MGIVSLTVPSKLSHIFAPRVCARDRRKVIDTNAADKKIIFVTNNATKSRLSYRSKFVKLGVQADIVNASAHCQYHR